MRPASCSWRKCLGCEILMQVVPSRSGLRGRLYHDNACKLAHYKSRPVNDRRSFLRNDLTGKILGGIYCIDFRSRSETCWVTMWLGKCISCGREDWYRSTDLRFNPPIGCPDCRKKAR